MWLSLFHPDTVYFRMLFRVKVAVHIFFFANSKTNAKTREELQHAVNFMILQQPHIHGYSTTLKTQSKVYIFICESDYLISRTMVLDDKLGINYGTVDNDDKTAETEKYAKGCSE